ncbi:Mat2a [Symbiodinium sp. CCMP2592]|nr:Mat2a [Symbiodinium sp. CCMP2592]
MAVAGIASAPRRNTAAAGPRGAALGKKVRRCGSSSHPAALALPLLDKAPESIGSFAGNLRQLQDAASEEALPFSQAATQAPAQRRAVPHFLHGCRDPGASQLGQLGRLGLGGSLSGRGFLSQASLLQFECPVMQAPAVTAALAMPEALPDGHFLFSSEATTEGHFDKLCDRVADAVLDTCLSQDAESRVLCEACAKSGMVMILGEVVSKASIQYEQVIREAVKAVGYDSDDKGLDWRTMNVIVAVEDQGPDIAASLGSQRPKLTDDQAVVVGYATDETEDAMPLSHALASQICAQMDRLRRDGVLTWLRPDARAQVTVEYKADSDGALLPQRVHSISVIYSHLPEVKPAAAEKDLMDQVVKPVVPDRFLDSSVRCVFAPRARRGASEAGFSGRRCDADGYGGWVPGGVLSGRDGWALGRAAYGARWAARSLVAAGLCRRCEVRLTFDPQSEAAGVQVHSFGTSRSSSKTDTQLAEIVTQSFDFRPSSLQRDLNLKGPLFQRLSAYGHFGRKELDLPWEKPKALQ